MTRHTHERLVNYKNDQREIEHLILTLARRYARGPARNDRDDLAQEARVVVLSLDNLPMPRLNLIVSRVMIDRVRAWYGRTGRSQQWGKRRYGAQEGSFKLDAPMSASDPTPKGILLPSDDDVEEQALAAAILSRLANLGGRNEQIVKRMAVEWARGQEEGAQRRISSEFGVTESRISQLRTRIYRKEVAIEVP